MKNNDMIRVESITTKFGTAKINNDGYWWITSSKEGNHMKFLHRLIFEDYHDCKLDKNDIIHHIDGDTLNNHPANLICISKKAHNLLHHRGRKHSDDTKQKMSESRNSTGYFRVCKQRDNTCKQGFTWKYKYVDEEGKQKTIESVDIEKLEEKVKAKGLKWLKFEEED